MNTPPQPPSPILEAIAQKIAGWRADAADQVATSPEPLDFIYAREIFDLCTSQSLDAIAEELRAYLGVYGQSDLEDPRQRAQAINASHVSARRILGLVEAAKKVDTP